MFLQDVYTRPEVRAQTERANGGMLDCVGFDTAMPSIINDFSRGEAAASPQEVHEESDL